MNPKCKDCLGRVPQRYVFSIMGFLGLLIAYAMRNALSIAIPRMVIRHNGTIAPTDFTCPMQPDPPSSSKQDGDFDWSEPMQGLVLSSFYWGYVVTHVPGGLVAEKFGGKYTMGIPMFINALLTFATPPVAHLGAGYLIALRIVSGLCQGVLFPAVSVLLANWVPPSERNFLATLVYSGVNLGLVVVSVVGGVVIQYTSWPNVFYLFASAAVFWFVLWCLICYENPKIHPFISVEERDHILEKVGSVERKKGLKTPWKSILSSVPVWALIVAEIGHDWGWFVIVTDLPKYMNDVLHFNISTNGFLSALPFLCVWIVSLVGGKIADTIIKKKWMTPTHTKVMLATIASVGPAVGVVGASYSGCAVAPVIALFAIGMGLCALYYPSLRTNSLDLSPNFAGTLMAIVNGLGAIPGMIGPYITGVLTPNRILEEWRVVFWLMFALMIGSNFAFMFFGTAKVQPWNDPDQQKAAKNQTPDEKGAK